MEHKFGWTDIDDIAIELSDRHPDRDPLTIRFTELRKLVEALPDFQADPDHAVNEQILEAIQAAWIEEQEDAGAAPRREKDDDDDEGDDEPRYESPRPYKPED